MKSRGLMIDFGLHAQTNRTYTITSYEGNSKEKTEAFTITTHLTFNGEWTIHSFILYFEKFLK